MRAAATVFLVVPALLAQQGTPEKPAAPPPPTQPAKAPDIAPPGPQRTFDAPRLYRIEGKVLMAGGGPPPDKVTITAVCAGQAMAKSTASDNGTFSLQIGAYAGQSIDASVSRGAGATGNTLGSPQHPPSDCAIHASLPGFQANPVHTGQLNSSFDSTRTLLILKPIENVSGYTFSATTLSAPPAARKARENGLKALNKNQLPDAERELRRAVQLHPKFAVAWYDLGRVLVKSARPAEARAALDTSVLADPKLINPYPLLAQLDFDEKRWDDLARHTARVIALNPFFSANIYLFSAQANLVQNHLDIAEGHAREAIRMDTNHQLPVAARLLERILEKKSAAPK